MIKNKRLTDAYRFQGFAPSQTVKGIFGDPMGRVIYLNRNKKKRFAQFVEKLTIVFMIESNALFEISHLGTRECIWNWRYVVLNAGGVEL
jgi:hypothetical protein